MKIDLYLASACELAAHSAQALSLLYAKRRAEAESFWEEKDRLLHCAAGLLLRSVLGVTQEEQLVCGEFGKPELVDASVQFSLSHAGHYAALAVSDGLVGVDIEPLQKPQVLPRKMLTGEEMAWLEAHPSAEDFCLLWTRLESALKAQGCGLALEKREFSLLTDAAPWHWRSLVHEGHLVTCAAMEPMEVALHVLPTAQLLQPER